MENPIITDNNTIETPENLGIGLYMAIAMSFLAAIICVVLYHFLFNKSSMKLAVVDVQSISVELEAKARNTIINTPDISEEQKKAAMAEYETGMKSLQSSILKTGQECGCTLLIKAAVLNNEQNSQNHIADLTSVVKQKMAQSQNTSGK